MTWMNRFARTLNKIAAAFAAMAVASASAQQPPDGLLFRNGDSLKGQLLAIDPQNAVHWRLPDAAEPIDFKPDTIAQIDLQTPKDIPAHPEDSCRVLLANGDLLAGKLISYDRKKLALDTWYAGQLTIPRDALQSVAFIPHSPAIFDGISGLDGWTQSVAAAANAMETGRWSYRNGAFYADKSASIARDLKLPDLADIQFDLAWKGTLNLAIAIYTDSLQPVLLGAKDQAPDFGGFYSFRLQNPLSFSVDLWGIKKAAPIRYLGQSLVPAFNNKERVHVDLHINKAAHKIALSLDDVAVKEWDDPDGFIGEGTDMRFVQNPGGVVKLSNLRITKWDGKIDQTAPETPDPTQDSFWPENRAKMAGYIESISNGKMTAQTKQGKIEFPVEQLKSIEFAHREPDTNAPPTDTVRGTFAQGGVLTFTLEKWRPDEMLVHSPDFGKAKINPAVFTRLQFVPAEKKSTEGPNG